MERDCQVASLISVNERLLFFYMLKGDKMKRSGYSGKSNLLNFIKRRGYEEMRYLQV
jgi:hypothetical protein